jgi:hypothetical protein
MVEMQRADNSSVRASRLTTFVLLMISVLMCQSARADTDCSRLRYYTARNFIAPKGSQGLMQLSLRSTDITLSNLLCLAQGFRHTHPEWKSVVLLFFDSPEAAEGFMVGWQWVDFEGQRPPFEEFETHLRAGYYLDIDRPEEYLLINPFGWQAVSPDLDTRIDLPVKKAPHCSIELNHRCLLAAALPRYPKGGFVLSGAVTLAGRVGQDGKMTGIHVISAQSTSPDSTTPLVKAAVTNFETWRLDPSTHTDSVQITYRFPIDPSILRGTPTVQVSLPTITVRGIPTN